MFLTCSGKKKLPKSSCMLICNRFFYLFKRFGCDARQTDTTRPTSNHLAIHPFWFRIIHMFFHLHLQSTTNVTTPPPTHPPSNHFHHPHKKIIFVYNQQRTSLPPTHPPFQTLSSSTQEHHLRLQPTPNVITPPPHPPPLPNTFIIHTRTSSSFTTNTERHYPPHPPPLPNTFIIHTRTSSSFTINTERHDPKYKTLTRDESQVSVSPRTTLWIFQIPMCLSCFTFVYLHVAQIVQSQENRTLLTYTHENPLETNQSLQAS